MVAAINAVIDVERVDAVKAAKVRVLELAVEEYALGGRHVGSSICFKTKTKGMNNVKFNAGPCLWLGLLEECGDGRGWSSQAIADGYSIYRVLRYYRTGKQCGRCKGEKVEGTGKDCIACKGSGRSLQFDFTNYLVYIAPGSEQAINCKVGDLRSQFVADEAMVIVGPEAWDPYTQDC